jgi:hypothetical protein
MDPLVPPGRNVESNLRTFVDDMQRKVNRGDLLTPEEIKQLRQYPQRPGVIDVMVMDLQNRSLSQQMGQQTGGKRKATAASKPKPKSATKKAPAAKKTK